VGKKLEIGILKFFEIPIVGNLDINSHAETIPTSEHQHAFC
jgi:hypothetical protein